MSHRQRQRRAVLPIGRVLNTGALVVLAGLVMGVAAASAATPQPRPDLERARAIVVAVQRAAQDPQSVTSLEASAAALKGAIDPSLWVDPSRVVAPGYGETMFRETRIAMSDLHGVSAAPLTEARTLVIGAERQVAAATIAEAAGANSGALARAQGALTTGDRAADAGHVLTALAAYQAAWRSAFSALTDLITTAVTSIPTAELEAAARAAIANKNFAVYSPSLVKDATPLKSGDRVKLFFLDWEFCPYCATQSWGLTAALSQFGTFHGLRLVSSDPRDGFSVAGFTYRNVSFSSPLLALESVVQYSSVPKQKASEFEWPYQSLQTPTPEEANLLATYDDIGGAPFLDIGNAFTTLGSSVNIEDLRGYEWAQIVGDLRDPQSLPAQAVAATAETLTAEICEATDEHPASICQTPLVRRYEDVINGATGGGYCPGVVAATASRAVRRPTRPARRRLIFRRHGKPLAHAARCSV
jgi:hypothetical protein